MTRRWQIACKFLCECRRVGRDNDGNTHRSRQAHAYAIGRWIFQDLCIQSAAFHCISQSGDVRFPRFRLSAARSRGGVLSPVIEDVRNVHDFSRLFSGAQCEIVVLRQIELLAETPHGESKLAAVCAQMAEVHEGVEQFRTPFWFKEWSRPLP